MRNVTTNLLTDSHRTDRSGSIADLRARPSYLRLSRNQDRDPCSREIRYNLSVTQAELRYGVESRPASLSPVACNFVRDWDVGCET